jgi:hypothetical protein
MNKLNILDVMSMSDYRQEDKDYITSLLYDNFMSNSNATLYFKSQSKTIIIRLILDVTFKGTLKVVPILIYLNRGFPNCPPDIFIEKVDEIGLSPQNLYTGQDFKLKTPKLLNWNKNNGLMAVVSEIQENFNKNFPIYKLDLHMRNKQYYPPETILNRTQLVEFNFDAPIIMNKEIERNNMNYGGDQNNFNNPPYHHSKSDNHLIVKPKKVTFSDTQIKEILINEIAIRMLGKFKKEYCTINQQQRELVTLKNDILQKREVYANVVGKKDEIINNFNIMTTNLRDQVDSIQNYIVKARDKQIHKDNIDSFLFISDDKLIRLISVEATVEDYLSIIKKAFEKGVLTFKDCNKEIRSVSRELLRIKFYRNKLTLKQ